MSDHPAPDASPLPALEVGALVIKDRAGTVRARLGPSEDDALGLALYSRDGLERAWLGLDAEQHPALEMLGTAPSVRRLMLTLDDHDEPVISLLDEHETPRLMLMLEPQGVSLITRCGEEPGPIMSLRLEATGQETVLFRDGAGRPAVAVGVDEDGSRRLAVADRTGEERILFWVDPSGAPGCALLGRAPDEQPGSE